jgi:transcriptional regulator with XRE-family HTH domain
MEMSKVSFTEHIATEDQPFHFADSGLENVYLVGIKYFVYEDGKVMTEIPALKQLMKLIAKDLVYSPDPLSGSEIRFLRKRMGFKAIDMAASLFIEPESLSRIENGHQDAGIHLDIITRLTYCSNSGDDELQGLFNEVMKSLREHLRQPQSAKPKEKVITMKVNSDHNWEELPQAA